MNILQRIYLVAVAGIVFALAAGAAPFGDRVSEVCVVAGEINYCAPRNP